jgi:hypothetical protein
MPEKRVRRILRPVRTPSSPPEEEMYEATEDEANEEHPIRPNYQEGEAIRGGWGASQEAIDSTSSYAQAFKTTTDTQIIKFLQATPYAAFRRHWIDRVGIGKRAYVCLQTIGKDCPLCDIGDKPGAVTAFNIALLSDDGVAAVKSWDCGVKLTQQLKTYHNDPKIGPIDKPTLYFAVSKSEATKRQQVTTMVNPVRERDLLEDWKTPPLDEPQIVKLNDNCYTADIITVPSRRELEEIAAEMTGEDYEEQPKGWGGS